MNPNRTGPIERATDGRDSSRKWRLVIGGILLYTFVHFVNAAGIGLAVALDWIESADARLLWTHSVTIWSGGVVFFAGIYTAGNVAQKFSQENGKAKK